MSTKFHPFSEYQLSFKSYVVVCRQEDSLLLLCSTQMFVLPSWIAMTIATTRLHRSLVNFADSESTCVYDALLNPCVLLLIDVDIGPLHNRLHKPVDLPA